MRDETGAVRPLYIVGLGASASGLEGLCDLLSPLRPGQRAAYVVLPQADPDTLPEGLRQRALELTLAPARGGETLAARHIYTLPPGQVPGLRDGRLTLTPCAGIPPPPIESFLDGLAPQERARTQCVILSRPGGDTAAAAPPPATGTPDPEAENRALRAQVDELTRANAELRNFFHSAAPAIVTLAPDLRIRGFTPAARTVFALDERDHGRRLTELPDAPQDAARIEATAREVIASGAPAELRIVSRDGAPVWLLAISPYRLSSGAVAGASLAFSDITEAVALQDDLAVEGERLRLALEIGRIGVWEMSADRQRIKIDARVAEFFGLEAEGWQAAGRLYDRLPEADRQRLAEAIDGALARGEGFDAMYKVILADGSRRFLRSLGQVRPSPAAGGQPRLIGVKLDVTAEVEAAQMRELMLREMNHRVKNLFSIISGMLRLAARNAGTPKALVDDVGRRISALARSHDLTQGGHDGTPLEEIVRATIAPHVEDHAVSVSGPPVRVSAAQLTSLALILHEWATNSAKYGVLGPSPGRLQVSWRKNAREGVENTANVVLEWNEFFDRALSRSSKGASEGFGTTLVNLSAAQLGGRVDVEASGTRRTNRLSYDTDERSSEQE